jgi:choline kinase
MKKYNLLIPIAGLGSRFVKENYFLPKPLILVDNRSIIEWTMDCVDHSECNIIFIVRKEHIVDFNIDGYLKTRFGNDVTIIPVDKTTDGAVCSCLLAEEYINNDLPLIIHCSDIYFEPKFDPSQFDSVDTDGVILTFKSNSKNYSYVELNEQSLVTKTAEKQVISPNAAVGIYWYRKGSDFVKYAKDMIQRNIRTNNEFFICPLYNIFIEKDCKILTKPVEKMHVFGQVKNIL